MKVVLTNDDGIDAPGLASLELIFQQFSTPVVVAPQEAQSGVGHRVTTHSPGANLGSDVYQSGTLAAAREAAILGYRSIAISQYIARDRQVDWDVTRFHATKVLNLLLKKGISAGQYWNVNLPHPIDYHSQLEYTFCSLDKNPHRYGYRREADDYYYNGIIHERPRDSGCDVAVCFGGQVSITLLTI